MRMKRLRRMKRLGEEDSGYGAFAAGLAETLGEVAGPGRPGTAAAMHTHATNTKF